MNPKRWAPVAAVAAVLAVLVGVSFLSKNGGEAGPAMLRLASADGTFAAAEVGGRGSYRLVGTLPDGPSEARVRDLPATAGSVATVRALAVALGETAAPVRLGGTWTSGDLVVHDQPGNPWTWGMTCGPDTPVSSVPSNGGVASDLAAQPCAGATVSSGPASGGGIDPDSSTSGVSKDSPGIDPGTSTSGSSAGSPGTVDPCPSPPPGTEQIACVGPGPVPRPLPLPAPLPEPEKILLTKAEAMAATATLRDSLGLGDDPTRVEGLSVVVEPQADGVPTHGIPTVLQLSSKAELISAIGYLSTGQEGDSYPLRTARKAFDGIPVLALGAPCDAAGCPEGPAITGARLGLSRMALDKGAAALVPAWLFTVEDSPVPLVAVAVAERFLVGPDPAKTEPGPPDPGVMNPGTIEPDPAGSPPPPSTGKPAVPTDREPFGFDGAYADADPTVLLVRYGDSGSCPSQGVRHDVAQEPDRVVVTLTRTPMPADQPCTADYRPVLVRVTLSAALADRAVVDGFRGETVPISKGSPPFG